MTVKEGAEERYDGAALKASPVSATDRSQRFDASMSADLARIRSEYIEMPGLV